jgi:hypothetical protein
MPAGRPVIYTEEKLKEISEAMDEYTDMTEIPILAEFAYLHNIRKATLYEHKQLSYSIKRMMEKKEFTLEKLAMAGETNSTFAIFSLKQMGWRDKHEVAHTVDTSVIDALREKYENK